MFFWKGVGLTSDLWKEEHKKRNFISLTLHYFDGQKIKYFILKSGEFDKDSKTAERILHWFQRSLGELFPEIPNYFLVTDSGSNYVAAFKELNTRLSCVAHSLHLAVTDMWDSVKLDSRPAVAVQVNKIMRECKSLATHFNHSKPSGIQKTIKNVVCTR